MDMLSPTLINLYDPQWPIRAKSPIRPPHSIGRQAEVVHSIITEGCTIEGHVENSVLSNSVTVGAGARVLYSILHPGVVVEPGAVVEYAILGEGTVVGAGAHIGAQPDGTDGWGVATVGPDTAVPAGGTVPAGAMIYDGAEVHV